MASGREGVAQLVSTPHFQPKGCEFESKGVGTQNILNIQELKPRSHLRIKVIVGGAFSISCFDSYTQDHTTS